MAELFGAAAAAAAVLEQSIQLVDRVRRAARRQRGLPELLEKYSAEISRVRTIIDLVEHEKALMTPNVSTTITKLADVGEILRNHLSHVAAATTKGRFRAFTIQLMSGRQNQERLDEIMKDLGRVKQDLSMYIQLANVGLLRGVDETVRVNTAVVEAVNKALREKSMDALKIWRLVEGRPREPDGTVVLTADDIASLSKLEDVEGSEISRPIRRIAGNEASQHALQVNTPIGADVWEGVGPIVIEGNKASSYATQWNYPIASADVFLAALEAGRAGTASKSS